MGKSRRNRGKASQRADPIAKPVKPPSDPELAALRETSILPVLKDLQSSDPKSRTSAATAVANIIQDTKCRKLLLREQVVHIILTETLTDAILESRAAGWEILKLLTQEEEADFCIHLSRLDVLTAIGHAAQNIINSPSAPSAANSGKVSKVEQTLVSNIAEALTAILSALAEAQDDILEAIVRQEQIIKLLFALVSGRTTAESVLNSALSCMLTLTEDNRHFVERILGDEANVFKHLVALKAGQGLGAVLACGILHNVFSVMQWDDANPGREKASDALLIPSLSQALEATRQSSAPAEEGKDAANVELVQLALEILASIGTSLQEFFEKGNKAGGGWKGIEDEDTAMDADEDEDGSDKEPEGEDDDEMNEDEIEADMELVTAADDHLEEAAGLDDLPTLKLLIQRAVPQIVKIAQSSNSSDETSLLIRTHAFTALNNVAWTISCLDFSSSENTPILSAWTPAAQLIWKQGIAPVLASDTSDVALATTVTSLAWAIARVLREKTPRSGDEHAKFISLYHASASLPAGPELEDDPFQSLGVRCVGVLGQLALDPAPVDLNREIGVFLLTVVARLPDTPAADTVEALNQLFDIYGDEIVACDKEVFWKNNFLKHFEDLVPKVRAMVKKVDKRKHAELRTRADEVLLNLGRFVQYKQKHKPE